MVDQKIKKRALHRAKIIRGQLDGLSRAIEREDYCTKLLEQSFAMREALKSLERLLLENHLKTHVAHQFHKKDGAKLATMELVKIYQQSNRV